MSDMDTGYYKDRESDADSGERREVSEQALEREDILKRLVVLGHSLSNYAAEVMRWGDKVKNEAMAELRGFNV